VAARAGGRGHPHSHPSASARTDGAPGLMLRRVKRVERGVMGVG